LLAEAKGSGALLGGVRAVLLGPWHLGQLWSTPGEWVALLPLKCYPGTRVVSGRSGGFAWPTWWRRRWYDLSGERARAGDHDQLPVAAAADLEELVVCFLEDSQHVGHQFAVI
jgi:hypothetical protein